MFPPCYDQTVRGIVQVTSDLAISNCQQTDLSPTRLTLTVEDSLSVLSIPSARGQIKKKDKIKYVDAFELNVINIF